MCICVRLSLSLTLTLSLTRAEGWVDGWDESEKVRDEKYEREGRGMSSCGDEREGEGMGGWVRAGMRSMSSCR